MDWEFATKFLGALFAIMNPFINLPIFLALTRDRTVAQQRAMAIMISPTTKGSPLHRIRRTSP